MEAPSKTYNMTQPSPKSLKAYGLDGPEPQLSSEYASFVDPLPTLKARDCGLNGPEPPLSDDYMPFFDPLPAPKTRDCGLDGPEPPLSADYMLFVNPLLKTRLKGPLSDRAPRGLQWRE